MDSVVTAADVLWGPIALIVNINQHGLTTAPGEGFAEVFASAVGTMLWATAAGVVGRVMQ